MNYFPALGYDCYAISLRGHGQSEGRDQLNTFSLDDYVEDVYSVVSTMNRKPVIVGHSMGGAVVQKYLKKHQDTVSGPVLLASATAGGIPLGNAILVTLKNKSKSKSTTFFGNRFTEEDLEKYKNLSQDEYSTAEKNLLKNISLLLS